MPIGKTLVTCDRCGKEDTALPKDIGRDKEICAEKGKFLGVAVGLLKRPSTTAYYQVNSGFEPTKTALWCHECCVLFGLERPEKDEKVKPDEHLTIEDLIREIVREELPQ